MNSFSRLVTALRWLRLLAGSVVSLAQTQTPDTTNANNPKPPRGRQFLSNQRQRQQGYA